MNNQFNAVIAVQHKEGKNYSGTLSISTGIPLNIESIVVEVSLVAAGAMSPISETLVVIDLLAYRKSLAIGIQKFPFDFSLEKDAYSMYKGKYVSINYDCTAKIYMDDDNYRKLDLSLFKNLLTYVKKTNQIIATEYFEYHKETNGYQVVDKAYELIFLNPTVLITAALVYTLSYLYILYRFYSFSFVSVFFGIIFGGMIFVGIIYGIYYKLSLSSKKIKAHISPYKNQFQCKISGLRLVRNPKIHYRIIEKVVDKRGTSSTTHKHTIYKSPIKKLSSLNTMLFDYPTNNNWATMELRNVELFWEIVIKGNKNSLYGKFEVKNKH